MADIAVIVWSLYGHIAKLTDEVVKGVEATGAKVTVYQIPETLSEDVIGKMYGNKEPISKYPVIKPDDLTKHDGFLFGFPTRYGRAPAQVSAFFDQTGGLWAKGALVNKFAGVFTSTASQGGGRETTVLTTIPFFAHHGIIYVPFGYQLPEQSSNEEVAGGSAWGAHTLANGDGSRQPTAFELKQSNAQGTHFAKVVNQYVKGA
ncbi:unnamed protein product [Sympodiomycopsis kandeliae]